MKKDQQNKDSAGVPAMSMVTTAKEVTIATVGEGKASIDWGDGTVEEITVNDGKHTHSYSESTTRTITIKGENITQLSCSRNELTILDVSNNTALTNLICFDNNLTYLGVSNNINLTELRCGGNKLTNLDISNNPNLTKLDCIGNQLINLDVSNNPNLKTLNCAENKLTNLNVSNNPNLLQILCFKNELTYLDISNCIALTGLNCHSNQLKDLDISKNIALTVLRCSNNQFTCIDVSHNPNLRHLYFSSGRTLKQQQNAEPMKTLVQGVIEKSKSALLHENGVSEDAIASGFGPLDRLMNGFRNSTLTVIAGRPAMGKTAFALSLVRNIAIKQNKPVAYFSLEMSAMELTTRLVSCETDLKCQKIKTGQLYENELAQLQEKSAALAKAPIFIGDSLSLNMEELSEKCHRLKQEHHIQMVFVDNLLLIRGDGEFRGNGNREKEVSKIMRQLKALANELEIPVLATLQLNRSIELRDRRPQLNDLCTSIAQDADMVMFVHRPEFYGITEDEYGNSLLGVAEIIVEKNRSGPTGTAILKYIQETPRFEEFDVFARENSKI